MKTYNFQWYIQTLKCQFVYSILFCIFACILNVVRKIAHCCLSVKLAMRNGNILVIAYEAILAISSENLHFSVWYLYS